MSVKTSTGMDVQDWLEMQRCNLELAVQNNDRNTIDAVLSTIRNAGFEKEAQTLVDEYIALLDSREHRYA